MARVFLSSTFSDMREYREAAVIALRRMGQLGNLSVAGIESFPATELTLEELLQDQIGGADYFIGLYGSRYGAIAADKGKSYIEIEYDIARQRGIPSLVFILEANAAQKINIAPADFDEQLKIEHFKRRLLSEQIVSFFRSPDDLVTKLTVSLANTIKTGKLGGPGGGGGGPVGADVFLSYAHEDAQIAEALAKRFEREKWLTFWDRTIPVGLRWDQIVEGALDAARCVVVLWSRASTQSEWVIIEANEGAERKILTPAIIDDTKIPLRFRLIQAANLTNWRAGANDSDGLMALLAAVSRNLRQAK